jgi:antitoxin component of RelBE/YafQ-DinJ toxin-antitoxin module
VLVGETVDKEIRGMAKALKITDSALIRMFLECIIKHPDSLPDIRVKEYLQQHNHGNHNTLYNSTSNG